VNIGNARAMFQSQQQSANQSFDHLRLTAIDACSEIRTQDEKIIETFQKADKA
jgi:hypothetical protein